MADQNPGTFKELFTPLGATLVFGRHYSPRTGQRLTKVLMDGMGSDNPRQLFSTGAWAKAHPTYIRHGSSNRYWRLGEATDTA